MEEICKPSNLNQAFLRVKANAGAAGIDGMTVGMLRAWLSEHKETLIVSLLDGTFRPQSVRGISIPKLNGGKRLLGIPTAIDRLVQQAILQVLTPLFEPLFSESSFGFRPGRSAHGALLRASEFVSSGRRFVVDVDVEAFFDRVNHDLLMARVAKTVKDKRLLRLIRSFLEAGIMQAGVVCKREEGTPQGGPLSPLLANILLDDLDKELERRGHAFVRYADDCNVYVASQAAADRVLESISKWLHQHLRLKVNAGKSAASPVEERQFLGYTLTSDGHLTVSTRSVTRFRLKVIALTKRRHPSSLEGVIEKLGPLLRGWWNYFRLDKRQFLFRSLDGWIRRRLRCLRLHQCKRAIGKARFLMKHGVKEWQAWTLALSGKGNWRLSLIPTVTMALGNRWFEEAGLFSFQKAIEALKG